MYVDGWMDGWDMGGGLVKVRDFYHLGNCRSLVRRMGWDQDQGRDGVEQVLPSFFQKRHK